MSILTSSTLCVRVGAAVILCSSATAWAQDNLIKSNGRPVESSTVPASPFALNLGGMSFDPSEGLPDFPAGWNQARRDVPDLRLVQFTGPIQQQWLDALEGRGLRVIQYIHPYSYVVWGDAEAIDQLTDDVAAGRADAVRWAGDFVPAFRVQPQFRSLPAAVVDVRLMIYRGTDVRSVIGQIIALGGVNTGRRAIDDHFEIATFRMPGALLGAAAQIPGVYAARPVPTDGGLRGEMTNMINLASANGLVSPGYQSWLTSVGINGTGVRIANVDGGVSETHPDLINRFVPCTGTTCSSTASTHGTHTAGIMAADGSSGTTANGGFLRGQGVAPGANLIEQVYSPWFTQAGGMLLLMTDSQRNGASLSGNSWGPSGSPQGYDDDTRQVDVGVRDADPAAPGNQPLTFVLSFMNGGGGTSTQGTPDEAKNIFNIGSTKAQLSGSGAQITAINDLSSNTAHGPALDGRTIPHMVAPGCSVDSTTTSTGYGLLCGTSMASPHVSGAVALFIQKYRTLPGVTEDPSPALIKAAFLANCFSLAGNLDANGNVLGHPFDSKQGWGRMNLAGVIAPPAFSTRYYDNPVVFNNTGEEWSTTVTPLDPNQPMRIMLVWTDAPGHGLGGSTPAWVNDLDLIVETPSGQYRGNNFNSATGWSQTGGIADNKNNTEGVFLGPTAPSSATIRVRATNIAGDGVPNFGDGTDQDFALVVYNGAVEPGFALQVLPASQIACAPATSDYTVNVTQILGFSDPVTLSTSGLPAGASASFVPNPVAPGGSAVMTINPGSATAGTHPFTINGVSGAVSRQAFATYVLSTSAPPAPVLSTPANNATGVGLVPTLVWAASAGAATYAVEVSTSAGFGSLVYSATGITTTSHALTSALSSDTQYYWRVRGNNACGNGAYSATFTFRTADVPAILLVDDDDNTPDVRPFYTAALDALNLPYDVWNTNNTDTNEPTAAQLSPYRIVIWFTGDAWQGGLCGPGAAGEAALAQWLDSGGKCLFMSSQDYHYVHSLTPFISGRLGVSSVSNDSGNTSQTGANVFAGYGPFTLTAPSGFFFYIDRVTPGNGGITAFTDSGGIASSTTKDAGSYRTIFFTFPFEALPNAAARQAVMERIVNWCDELVPQCPPDINNDGQVNVTDLLAVIGAWGACAPPCPADVNGDGQVNVTDLLAVIGAWGACP